MKKSWWQVLALMSSRNPASTPEISAAVVSTATASSAHSTNFGSTSGAGSLVTCWLTQTMSASGVMSWPIDGRQVSEMDVNYTTLDVEATFCYLGDMLCCGGGCDSAISGRCCVAWGKFRHLLLVLTTRRLSLKVCGKVFATCINSVMPFTCSGSAAMTTPWSTGFVTPKTKTKLPQLH